MSLCMSGKQEQRERGGGACYLRLQKRSLGPFPRPRLCLPRAAAAGADPWLRAEPPVVAMEPRVRRRRRRRRDVRDAVDDFDDAAFVSEELAVHTKST